MHPKFALQVPGQVRVSLGKGWDGTKLTGVKPSGKQHSARFSVAQCDTGATLMVPPGTADSKEHPRAFNGEQAVREGRASFSSTLSLTKIEKGSSLCVCACVCVLPIEQTTNHSSRCFWWRSWIAIVCDVKRSTLPSFSSCEMQNIAKGGRGGEGYKFMVSFPSESLCRTHQTC